jgi:hypothetical protein
MPELQRARSLAARVRLSEDKAVEIANSKKSHGKDLYKDSMLRHGLLISEAMSPLLEQRLSEVCTRLFVPRSSVIAFVYNSAEIQADCVIDSSESCVLRFTSGLINLMDKEQFQFVAAHELGHFLLGHGQCSQYTSTGSSEGFMNLRAQELSADRIGFLGIDNLDESIAAIIKTASGLGDDFLRFDVSSFMSQSAMLVNPSRGEARDSTHPSMLIRCRALLWFSMGVKSLSELEKTAHSVLEGIDHKVTRDLEKYVDGQIRAKKEELGNDIALWKACVLIVNEGSLKKTIQERLSDELGVSFLNGVKSFFESYEKNELSDEANKRLNASIASIYKEFPESAPKIERSGISRAYKIVEP